MPLVIGVTGSIATGKGLICETLVNLGAIHCDADKLVHRLYDPGKPAFDRIVSTFGRDIVGQDGYIDRKLLGGKVFGKPEEMRKLTQAIGDIGGAIKDVIDQWRDTLARDAMAIMESVNHVEAGYGQWTDVTWLVACDERIARQRLMSRNGLSEAEADQRLASQRKWQDREPATDLVLHNNGTQQKLIDRVRAEYQRIREQWAQGKLPDSRYYAWWKARSSR